MLTIKSGKKGPQTKNGIINAINKLIENIFEKSIFFIKNIQINITSLVIFS